jgi:hypothetical protein
MTAGPDAAAAVAAEARHLAFPRVAEPEEITDERLRPIDRTAVQSSYATPALLSGRWTRGRVLSSPDAE